MTTPDKDNSAALEALDELYVFAVGEGTLEQSEHTRELKEKVKQQLKQCAAIRPLLENENAELARERDLAPQNFEIYFKLYVQATGKTIAEAEKAWQKSKEILDE